MSIRKAQSAIEYLMTYGWMLLVVAVVGGAIFATVGDQNIESVQGFNSGEIFIDNFGMTPSSLQLSLEAYGANSITLKEIKLTDDAQTFSIPLRTDIIMGDTQIINLPHFKPQDGSNTVSAEIHYDVDKLENITASGTITGGLQLDDSLFGYWTLNPNQANNTHVWGLSQYQEPGEIRGDPEIVDDPEKGSVMMFDGENDFIEISHREHLNSESITIGLWVKNKGNGSGSYPKIVEKGGNNQWQIHSDPEGQRFVFNIGVDGNLCQISEDVFDRDKWVHAAATYDGETQKIYHNGELVDESSCPGGLETTSDNLTIGARSSNVGNYNGSINNLQIYSRALSENRIQALSMNPGLAE